MTRLYVIRHAEAEGNLYRRCHGWYDSLITQRGRRQIAALTNRFEKERIDAVYASDLFRTITTAGAICKPHGLELITRPDLREVHMGDWEDRPWGEIEALDGERLKQFNASSPDWRAPNGESYLELRARISGAVQEIARTHPGGTVAVVSHGTAIRMLLGVLHGLAPEEMGRLGHSDNTAVSCIEVEGDSVRVVFENDNTHLPQEISTLAGQSWWKEGGRRDANLRFQPLDMERESKVYYQARKEAWLSIHRTLCHFDGEGFVLEAREQARHDRRAVTAAYLGGTLVGLLQMDPGRDADKEVGYIPFCYMSPEYRKQGLGVQLLGEAVSVFRPLGRRCLRLRCAPDNYVAQRFYQRYGFRKVAEAQGTRVPLDILEKDISQDAV